MKLALLTPRSWPLAAAIVSAAMLAIAHGFERFGGLAPCTLCYRQREVYWAALAIGLAGFAATLLLKTPWVRRAVCAVLALAFLYGAGVAAYHAGVEWKWWPGPAVCSGGGGLTIDPGGMADLLAGKTISPPACDKAAWVFLGLSMAGWNALVSLGLAVVSALAAGRKADD